MRLVRRELDLLRSPWTTPWLDTYFCYGCVPGRNICRAGVLLKDMVNGGD